MELQRHFSLAEVAQFAVMAARREFGITGKRKTLVRVAVNDGYVRGCQVAFPDMQIIEVQDDGGEEEE